MMLLGWTCAVCETWNDETAAKSSRCASCGEYGVGCRVETETDLFLALAEHGQNHGDLIAQRILERYREIESTYAPREEHPPDGTLSQIVRDVGWSLPSAW